MLGKKIGSVKRLAKKIKVRGSSSSRFEPSHYECLLLGDNDQEGSQYTPVGCIALYVGEERRRFVVPTTHLSHPLFRMLLEKASEEFGFDQKEGLVVPCSVVAFQEVVMAVQCSNSQFVLGNLVEEFI